MNRRGEKYPAGVLIAYYLTLASFFVASFFPQYRVWGISWWAYFPLWVKFGLLGLGAVAPFAANRLIDKLLAGRDDITLKTYHWLVGGFAVTMTALFYLLRARTHFLGDGYTLLSTLGSENPLIKPRNLGGTIFQYWLMKLMGGSGDSDALLAYQIVSYVAGILFLTVTIWSSAKLLTDRLNRFLFVVTLSTGGYALLFFGYVENYSLFVVSVAAFGLAGLLIIKGRLSRWWVVPILAFSAFLHIFGVALIPACVIVIVHNTSFHRWVAARSIGFKACFGLAILAAAVGVFSYFYTTSLFFQLAIIPVVKNMFTVEGYTLLSVNHLLDYLNLLAVLFPGILVVVVVLVRSKSEIRSPETLFLVIFLLSCLGTAFIFDPKLGMPRDWDLFVFSGVPLLLMAIISLIHSGHRRSVFLAIVLLTTLDILPLLPRAISLTSPQQTIQHVKAYSDLDVSKSAPARFLILKYLRQHGDLLQASQVDSAFFCQDPDLYRISAFQSGQLPIDSAAYTAILRRAISKNPTAWGPWGNLGVVLLEQGSYDSALRALEISDALNPYNAKTYNNIAFAQYYLKNFTKAEAFWQKSFRYDTSAIQPLIGLAKICQAIHDEQRYSEYFEKIVQREDAPPEYLRKLGDYFVLHKRYQEAAVTYRRALLRGLNPITLDSILSEQLELARYFHN